MCTRICKAKFKQPASYEDIKPSSSSGLDKTTLQTLGTCEWIRKKKNSIVTGSSGCGKSFLSTGLSHKGTPREQLYNFYKPKSLVYVACVDAKSCHCRCDLGSNL